VSLIAVLWSCVVIVGLVALIVCHLVAAYATAAIHQRQQRDLERVWLPLLMDGLEQLPGSLPRLRQRDTLLFLSLWNRLHDAIKGASNAPLNRFALQLGLDRAARRLFARADFRARLLAVTTLGRLGDRAMWSELVRLASSPDLELSLAAARAIMRIDPRSATTLLLPIIAKRHDWPPSTVALILEEAGADVLSVPLVKAVLRAGSEDAHRLIRYLGLAHADATRPLLHRLIREVDVDESIMACLHVFTDADDLDAIYPYLNHKRWEVRVRAVSALGRLGTARDGERLVTMLSDLEWWVRYRAAQALCNLLSSDLDHVRRLKTRHRDPFARDILTHVLAEQGAS